jgi:hypothetical protein
MDTLVYGSWTCGARYVKVEVTYIPNNDRSWSPSHAGLDILRESNVVVKKFEEKVRFLLLIADDVSGNFALS